MKKNCNNTAYDYDLDSPEWQWRDEAEKQEAQRLFALEAQWQRKMAALRAAPCSEAVEETTIEQDAVEMHKAFRHDMSPEDWAAFQKLIHRQKIAKWQTFIDSVMGDYDSSEIFVLLQFKIDRMIDYWRQFSHLANGDRIRSQMELASRLLQIVIKQGNENQDVEILPQYVNLRNETRFEVRYCSVSFLLGKRQEVRFRKAYNLLFKLLQENILHWWD